MSDELNLARQLLLASLLEKVEPGLVVEWLYDHVGTGAVLLQLEALHRRDAQRSGQELTREDFHPVYAVELRTARETGEAKRPPAPPAPRGRR